MSPNFKRINKKLLHKNIFMPTVSSIDNYEFIFQNILDIFYQKAERWSITSINFSIKANGYRRRGGEVEEEGKTIGKLRSARSFTKMW